MTGTVVVMIIIGIIFIFVSFFLTEKMTNNETEKNLDLMTVNEEYEFSERELQIIKRKIEDVIANQAKDILYETNDSLASMANEKTLALGDYAVAVCEEIEKNHKEVMFLYSMLDDKQKEIMNTVRLVDATKLEIKELIKEAKQAALEEPVLAGLTGSAPVPKAAGNAVQGSNMQESSTGYVAESSAGATEPVRDERTVALDNEEMTDVAEEDLFSEIDQQDLEFDDDLEEEFEQSENSNDIILEMYRNGTSILDIAKQLGLGVGEVRLVIDLYQGV